MTLVTIDCYDARGSCCYLMGTDFLLVLFSVLVLVSFLSADLKVLDIV